ncbi:MAG: flagellar basal body P-ring formation chaperone FlgA [Alphaproteobacteria bacterium]|nr:flagellar basal body P-ring formation chaperone FlgA [Alphaproteobacteria bacterium]
MTRTLALALFGAGLGAALAATGALAAPVLKSEIMVSTPIVTVGDMFEGADLFAEEPLFRAPAPGTTGHVTLDAVRVAAARIGLTDFVLPGAPSVTVARFGETIGAARYGRLVEQALRQRGTLVDGVEAEISFNVLLPDVTADTDIDPVRLVSLSYAGGSGQFVARFMVSGRQEPVDLSGRADLVVAVPHLVAALSADAVIGPEDVEMRMVPVRTADTGSYATLDQVVGKQLKRPARAGKMLQPGDLREAVLIARNEAVTIVYRSGPLTLTVKGTSLGEAARGEAVQVLNLMSNKTLSAVAADTGLVTIADFGAMASSVR